MKICITLNYQQIVARSRYHSSFCDVKRAPTIMYYLIRFYCIPHQDNPSSYRII